MLSIRKFIQKHHVLYQELSTSIPQLKEFTFEEQLIKTLEHFATC